MMAQLLAHLWGDYLLQSDWMANNKRKRYWPAFVHAFIYSVCFVPIVWNRRHAAVSLDVILWTHFLIDRYGLARYLVWAKNWIGPVDRYGYWTERHPAGEMFDKSGWVREGNAGSGWIPPAGWKRLPWAACEKTGYPPDRPDWLVVWLTIIADNTLHLTINYLALRYL